jgi:hypothetical protein
LTLGEIETPPSEENRTLLITQLGQLHLSLQIAKRLVTILTTQIAAYEQQIGPIPSAEKE